MGDNSGGFPESLGPATLAAKDVLGRRGYWRMLQLGCLDSVNRRNANVARCKFCCDSFEPSGPKVPLLLHCGDSVCLTCVREADTDELQCPTDGKQTHVNRDLEVFGLTRNMAVIEMLDRKAAVGQTQRHLIDRKPEANGRQEEKPTVRQEPLPEQQQEELDGGGDKSNKRIPAEEFFTEGISDGSGDHSPESTEVKEAQKLWRRIQKERTQYTKEYQRQKAKLQADLKAAVESLNEEHDRQTTELQQRIAELQTRLDGLNASFSEQMKNASARSNNGTPSVEDELTPTDEGGRRMQLKTSPRDMYKCGLQILQEQEESLAKQDDFDSDLVARMNHCLSHQQHHNTPGLGESKSENLDESLDYQDLRESYLKQKDIYHQLKLHYDQEKREHYQAAVRYELRLSARDDLILVQDLERLRLLEKLEEQSRQIRQYSDMQMFEQERKPARATESQISDGTDEVPCTHTVQLASEGLLEPKSDDNTIPKVTDTTILPGPVLRAEAQLSKLNISSGVSEEAPEPESSGEANFKTEELFLEKQPPEEDKHAHFRCEDMSEAGSSLDLAPVLSLVATPTSHENLWELPETDTGRVSRINKKASDDATDQADTTFQADPISDVCLTLCESQPGASIEEINEGTIVQFVPSATSELLKPSRSSQEIGYMNQEAVEVEGSCGVDTEGLFNLGTHHQGSNPTCSEHEDPSESESKQVSRSTSVTGGHDEDSSRVSEADFSITSRLSQFDLEDNESCLGCITVDGDTTAPGAEGMAVHFEGTLRRKHVLESATKRASTRTWFKLFTVVHSTQMSFYKDKKHAKADPQVYSRHAQPLDLAGASATVASDYVKRDHVFRLKLSSGATYLFNCKTNKEMTLWIQNINATTAQGQQAFLGNGYFGY